MLTHCESGAYLAPRGVFNFTLLLVDHVVMAKQPVRWLEDRRALKPESTAFSKVSTACHLLLV